MANQEHLDLLKKGVKAWNKWRSINPTIRPDLQSANLHQVDLRNANLIESNLSFANLRSADLRESNLHHSDLRDADLSFANLRSANLHAVDLSYANLSDTILRYTKFHQANLSYTVLRSANLRSADLRNANLSFADLSFVNLSSAKLHKANLSYAKLCDVNLYLADIKNVILAYTTFDQVDLSLVKNIETVQHFGPSGVTNRTFFQSKGNIPSTFLKGAGLSDWEIESIKLYRTNLGPKALEDLVYKIHDLKAASPIHFFPVFLSHSSKDKAFARRLYEKLDHRGVRCWLDEKELNIGEKIIKGIDRGISLYDKLILICSKDALESWWVERELERILQKERMLNNGKPEKDRVDLLIPITIDDYIEDHWSNAWKTEINRYVIGDFRECMDNEHKFEQKVDQLVKALKVNPLKIDPPSHLPT